MRLFAGLFLAAQIVAGALGPNRVYTALYGQTYNLTDPIGNSYSIQPYNQVFLQPDVSLGAFQTYVTAANQYVYQSYTGGSTAGGCGSGRNFALELSCAQSVSLDTVIENPQCYYAGTMFTPAVCGVDMTVGQEGASATQTPTSSPSPLGVFTMFPSATATATGTPSTTPLFMITAWPTTSPVNVSATSTPLFYWTPYPSYDPNNGTLPFVGLLSGATGTTATILGGFAVGGIALVGIMFAVKHFRSGGSIKDLFSIFMANRHKLNRVLSQVPGVPDSVKKAIADPNSMLSPDAKKMLALAANPHSAIDKLDLPDSVKAEMKKHVPTDPDALLKKVTKRTTALAEANAVEDVTDDAPSNTVIASPPGIRPPVLDLDDSPQIVISEMPPSPGSAPKPKASTT
jgi:hypothetical protein